MKERSRQVFLSYTVFKETRYTLLGFSPFRPREPTFVTSCLFQWTPRTFWKRVYSVRKLNVKKTAFGNKELTTDQKMGVSVLLRLFIRRSKLFLYRVAPFIEGDTTILTVCLPWNCANFACLFCKLRKYAAIFQDSMGWFKKWNHRCLISIKACQTAMM